MKKKIIILVILLMLAAVIRLVIVLRERDVPPEYCITENLPRLLEELRETTGGVYY